MKNKALAVAVVLAMLFFAPLVMSLVWTVLAIGVGAAIWNKDKLLSAKDEIGEVLSGKRD